MPDMFEDGARLMSGAHEVATMATSSTAEQIYSLWRLGFAVSEAQFWVMVTGLGQEPPPKR